MSFAASFCGVVGVSSSSTTSFGANSNYSNRGQSSNSSRAMTSSSSSSLLFARNCSRALQQMLCSTSGRGMSAPMMMPSGSFGIRKNSRCVVTAALNGQQQGSAAAAPQQQQQQQRATSPPPQAVKPVQMPPRLTNNGVVKSNLPPFQSQMATTTRQQQQQEQQFRSIPPQPLPKVTNSNNNTSSSASNSTSPSSPSASESVLPQSRLEGKLLPDDVDAAYHQMQHLGQKWADLHAEAEILEEAKKCILATITLFHVDNGDAKSTAEVRAHASKEYQDHIKKMVEARRLANQAKIELESVKTHLNLVRTFESSRREELKML